MFKLGVIMEKIEFKSEVCTTKEQSKRLVKLGLKKETADMTLHYERATEDYELQNIPFSRIMRLREKLNKRPILGRSGDDLYAKDIPAWSLHRLMEIVMKGDKLGCITHNIHQNNVATYYELVIASIEHLIKIDEFNKDYLEEK